MTPSIRAQGTLLGSSSSATARPFSGRLSLGDAIQRGLEFNLSAVGVAHAVRQAEGRRAIARSALLPNIILDLRNLEQKVNLAALGVSFTVPVPGFSIPEVVGPFNVTDLRARLSQTVLDMTALNNYKAARESVQASLLSARDARDSITLAVGGSYLQVVAARARIQTARAQIETAAAIQQRTSERRRAGLSTPIDVNRAQVQLRTQQQRLVALQADFAKQKIELARMIGIPPTDQYELTDDVSFSAGPALTLEEALQQALERRSDLKAADARTREAERALAAAKAQRLPSVSIVADYGGSQATGTPMHQSYSVGAIVRVPVWEGGRAGGQIRQAEGVLQQRRAEFEDLKAQVESDVRRAYLDLETAASQVQLAQQNIEVSNENLGLTRQGFEAGLNDNLSVVQSLELVAAAELDRINGVFAHNLAKLDLARAVGRAAADVQQFLGLP